MKQADLGLKPRTKINFSFKWVFFFQVLVRVKNVISMSESFPAWLGPGGVAQGRGLDCLVGSAGKVFALQANNLSSIPRNHKGGMREPASHGCPLTSTPVQ